MNKEYTIYISAPESLDKNDWMNIFTNNLKMALSRTNSVSLKFITRNYNSENWSNDLGNVDTFICLLDENENNNEKYLNELYSISDQIQNTLKNSNSPNLYKIYLSPGTNIKQPALFKPLNGYAFFELIGRREQIAKFDFANKEQKSKAWNTLLDLAFDYRDAINSDTTINIIDTPEDKNYIYLTQCSSDQNQIRDELKRELQQFGYSILPNSDNIDIFEEGKEIIKEYLSKSSYIVQILGEKYGEILKGERVSSLEKESAEISNAISEFPHLKRLIWIPSLLKRKDQRQELFISRIKQKELNDCTEIIESSINEFKDILTKRLVIEQKDNNPEPISGEVYLISTPETNHTNLKSIAKSLKINLNTLDYKNQANLYHQHIDLLANSNNILIHWVDRNQIWLKSKLSDLVKAPGLGKLTPYSTIGILVNGINPDLTAYSQWLPNIHVIQHDNIDELKKYFQQIIE